MQTELKPELPALAEDVRGRWESNCAGEIFMVSDQEECGVRIGHFQGDAALAAHVVALHNATLADGDIEKAGGK